MVNTYFNLMRYSLLSSQIICCCQYELIDRYEISFSLMAMYLFPNDVLFVTIPLTLTRLLFDFNMNNMAVPYSKREPPIPGEHLDSPSVFSIVSVLLVFSVSCVVVLICLSLFCVFFPMFYVSLDCPL